MLGRLGADLLGGELHLHRDKAYAAIAEHIAGPLLLSVEAAAHGMLEILHNTRAEAMRAISIERGYDPLVNLRVSASGPARPWRFQPLPGANGTRRPPPATRAVYFPTAGGFVECSVYDDAALPSGTSRAGPAIITQDLSAIVVQPQHQVHLDSSGNFIMTIPQHM